jgi:hypothetical protein
METDGPSRVVLAANVPARAGFGKDGGETLNGLNRR